MEAMREAIGKLSELAEATRGAKTAITEFAEKYRISAKKQTLKANIAIIAIRGKARIAAAYRAVKAYALINSKNIADIAVCASIAAVLMFFAALTAAAGAREPMTEEPQIITMSIETPEPTPEYLPKPAPTPIPEPTPEPTPEPIDPRTLPRYEVIDYYAWLKGETKPVDVPIETQWIIYDMACMFLERCGFEPAKIEPSVERIMYGCFGLESSHNPRAASTEDSGITYYGLSQMSKYWISDRATRGGVPRFEDGWTERDLFDVRDHVLSVIEIWTYCVNKYGIDLNTDLGWIRLLYWHNTGKDPRDVTKWNYSTNILAYADMLEMKGGETE